jgi:hypothetical protein
MSELTQDFTKESLIQWIKEAFLFFKAPKRYVDLLSTKSSNDLIPQFVFYFGVYTSSFIFCSVSSVEFDVPTLIKPAIINLLLLVPTILSLCLSAKVVTRNFYFKKTLIFVLSIALFFGPIQLLLNALFLNLEDYFYRLICSCVVTFAFWLVSVAYGFIINGFNWKAVRITLVNLLILNALVFLGLRINFDNFSKDEFIMTYDPILDEYQSYASRLQYKDKSPLLRSAYVKGDSIVTLFGLISSYGDKRAVISSQENEEYKVEIQRNIDFLIEVVDNLKFKRNQKAAVKTLDYLAAVKTEINFQYTDTNELYKVKDLELFSVNKKTGERIYNSLIFKETIIDGQMYLRGYNNNIIRASRNSNIPTTVVSSILTLVGRKLNWFYIEMATDGFPPGYREEFLPFEKELF